MPIYSLQRTTNRIPEQGPAAKAASMPVTMATDQPAIGISGNVNATCSGTVAVSSLPAVTGTVAVTGVATEASLGKWRESTGHTLLEYENAGGHPLVCNQDYYSAISEGDIAGHSRFRRFGERANFGAGTFDLWGGAAATIPIPPDAGENLSVTSSGNDTIAGSGAQKVTIRYLDELGAEHVETVELNAGTKAMAAPKVAFINEFYVSQVGTRLGGSANAITIHSTATPANIYDHIVPGMNNSSTCQIKVPTGKTFRCFQWTFSCGEDNTQIKPVTGRLRATALDGTLIPGVLLSQGTITMGNSGLVKPYIIPRVFPAGTIVKITVVGTGTGSYASGGFYGWIE